MEEEDESIIWLNERRSSGERSSCDPKRVPLPVLRLLFPPGTPVPPVAAPNCSGVAAPMGPMGENSIGVSALGAGPVAGVQAADEQDVDDDDRNEALSRPDGGSKERANELGVRGPKLFGSAPDEEAASPPPAPPPPPPIGGPACCK
jgi:hypothetical protein